MIGLYHIWDNIYIYIKSIYDNHNIYLSTCFINK